MVRPRTSLAATAAGLALLLPSAPTVSADYLLEQQFASAGCTGDVLVTTFSPGTATGCVEFIGGLGMKYQCVDSTIANQILYMDPTCAGDPLSTNPVPIGTCDPAAFTIQTCVAGTAPASLPYTRASLAVDAYFADDATVCANIPAAANFRVTRQAVATGVCAPLNATHSYLASCDSATSTGTQNLYAGGSCGGSVVDRMVYPACGAVAENPGLAFVTTCLSVGPNPGPGNTDNGATTTTVPVGAAVGGSVGAVALGAAAFFAYTRGFSAEATRLI